MKGIIRVTINQRKSPAAVYIHRPCFFIFLFFHLTVEGTVTRLPKTDIAKMKKKNTNSEYLPKESSLVVDGVCE